MQETLINQYLKEQSQLSAVEKFSQKHEELLSDSTHKRYTELIPKQKPKASEQYAFEVDLDKCTGCKGCVTACHNENGLEEDETWRTVDLLQGGGKDPAILHVTSACHHCLEPACLSGCPVKAYEKFPDTGIVKHLDDQCIGCQYCILKCPYDVPKFNKKKGIVHKCDMCISRLEVGEAPACVRGCPNEVIRITLVDSFDVRKMPEDFVNIPDAPDSQYTFPTTRYKTNKKIPWDMSSSDYFILKPEHSHMPLVVMLVLTQLSVGAFGVELLLKNTIDISLRQELLPFHILLALATGMVALNASIFHLGRPLYAFRAVIGVMTSWLSREILAFSAFAFFAMFYVVYSLPGFAGDMLRNILMNVLPFGRAAHFLEIAVTFSGVVGVLCSVMVYKDTRRPFWDSPLTTVKFLLTSTVLGVATVLLATVLWTVIRQGFSLNYIMEAMGVSFLWTVIRQGFSLNYIMEAMGVSLCLLLMVSSFAKLAIEALIFTHLNQPDLTIFKKTAILMTQPLKKFTVWRFVCGLVGGLILPFLLMNVYTQMSVGEIVVLSAFIFSLSMIGEFLERYLFFKAVVPLK